MASSNRRGKQAYLPQENEYKPQFNSKGQFSGLKRHYLKFEPNGQCPCNSGLKYKKCCKGKKEYFIKDK